MEITKLPKNWTFKENNGNIKNYFIKNNKLYYDFYHKFINKWYYNCEYWKPINEFIYYLNDWADLKLGNWYDHKCSIIKALKEEEFKEFIKSLE